MQDPAEVTARSTLEADVMSLNLVNNGWWFEGYNITISESLREVTQMRITKSSTHDDPARRRSHSSTWLVYCRHAVLRRHEDSFVSFLEHSTGIVS